jgi:DNA-binding HxlR family transcriptional regulator
LKLVEFTKEGLILQALMEKPLRYKELKKTTGLSDAWLSKKLQGLQTLGIIASKEGRYHIETKKLQEALKHEKTHIARIVAQEIVKTHNVIAIILFGSLVYSPRKEADIDLIAITLQNDFNPTEVSLEMFRKFSVAVDILHVNLNEMLTWLYEPPPILFGVLKGYEILYDEGYIRPLLETLKQQTLKNWTYIPEKELWLKKELLQHISKPRKNTYKQRQSS